MTAPSIPDAAAAQLARVLLCDDHPAMLGLAVAALTGACTVVGAVVDGGQLLAAADLYHPDLIVLDISMPGLNGIEAARKIRRLHPAVRLVFLTVQEDPDFVRAAFAAGGLGYVVKSRLASDLLPAVQAALSGTAYLSSTLRSKPAK